MLFEAALRRYYKMPAVRLYYNKSQTQIVYFRIVIRSQVLEKKNLKIKSFDWFSQFGVTCVAVNTIRRSQYKNPAIILPMNWLTCQFLALWNSPSSVLYFKSYYWICTLIFVCSRNLEYIQTQSRYCKYSHGQIQSEETKTLFESILEELFRKITPYYNKCL